MNTSEFRTGLLSLSLFAMSAFAQSPTDSATGDDADAEEVRRAVADLPAGRVARPPWRSRSVIGF